MFTAHQRRAPASKNAISETLIYLSIHVNATKKKLTEYSLPVEKKIVGMNNCIIKYTQDRQR